MEPIYFNPHTDPRPVKTIARGTQVRVPSGVCVRSTHPARKSWLSKRSQVVKVDHELSGRYVSVREALDEFKASLKDQGFDLSILEKWEENNSPEFYRMMVLIDPPTVQWAGTGGYWCEVPVSAVEIIANKTVTEAV